MCDCTFICLLQNENVRRECTSERLVQDMRRLDRRTPVRVLVEKSFNFAGEIYGRITSSREKLTSGNYILCAIYIIYFTYNLATCIYMQ